MVINFDELASFDAVIVGDLPAATVQSKAGQPELDWSDVNRGYIAIVEIPDTYPGKRRWAEFLDIPEVVQYDKYPHVIIREESEEKPREALGLVKSIERIKSFLQLKENWDSYGASAISPIAAFDSAIYLYTLEKIGQPIYFISPSPNGDIMVELENEDRAIELEFFSDGRREFAYYVNDNIVREGKLEKVNPAEFAYWLNNY